MDKFLHSQKRSTPVRVPRHGVVERLPDGHRQQGFVLGTTGVTALRTCTGLIHDDPYCLYWWVVIYLELALLSLKLTLT
jgi:hypothetical protein